jgi:hypothetical protein
MGNVLVRGGLAVLALCVVGWLAVGYRADHLTTNGEQALAAAQKQLPPEQGREGLDDLKDAQWLNADQDPRVLEGELSLFMGKQAPAAVIAREVTAKEPDNVRGWFLAYLAENGAAKRKARAEVRRLDPWAGDRLR